MNQEQIAKVLAEHGQFGFDLAQGVWECLCDHPLSIDGDLNEKHIAHQAAMLAPLFTAAQAEAFEQGQKSGMRHTDRLIAAHSIGRPDLPGPISPNPYRTT